MAGVGTHRSHSTKEYEEESDDDAVYVEHDESIGPRVISWKPERSIYLEEVYKWRDIKTKRHTNLTLKCTWFIYASSRATW